MTDKQVVDARANFGIAEVGAGTPVSRQVNWYETFLYASRIAAHHGVVLGFGGLPIAGTQQWCGLPDDDARKLLSLILGGVREALSNETHQDAITAAGEEISAAENWTAAARQLLRRSEIDTLRKGAA